MAMASQGWEVSSTWAPEDEATSLLANHVTVRHIHSSAVSEIAKDARIRLVPGPEKQPCEITVKFQEQHHAVHHVAVLSSARICEMYRQNDGDIDAEYLCTERGQLEAINEASASNTQVIREKSIKLLFRTEMDLEDADMSALVTIRLLSLEDKSHVNIGHILILVSPGPFLAGSLPGLSAPAQHAVGGGASAGSLGALAPLMLQMAQGFSIPEMKNKLSFAGNASVESFAARIQQHGKVSHEEFAMHALAAEPRPSSVAVNASSSDPLPDAKSDASLEDVCRRLDSLEAVCARIEMSLCKTLESFDKRLQILEVGLNRS